MEIVIIIISTSIAKPVIQIQVINLVWNQLHHQCSIPSKDQIYMNFKYEFVYNVMRLLYLFFYKFRNFGVFELFLSCTIDSFIF